jgi:hypothetical protein
MIDPKNIADLEKVKMTERLLDGSIPEPNSGCWIWVKADDKRYGSLSVDGRLKKAHRLSFECFVGHIPDGIKVCHRCDNTFCVNPKHLFLGTQSDNMKDMSSKGRNPMQLRPERSSLRAVRTVRYGVDHHLAKLTPEKIREIRSKYQPGATRHTPEGSARALAREYGVNDRTITRIVRMETWIDAALKEQEEKQA